MFDFLKKKIGGFLENIAKNEEPQSQAASTRIQTSESELQSPEPEPSEPELSQPENQNIPSERLAIELEKDEQPLPEKKIELPIQEIESPIQKTKTLKHEISRPKTNPKPETDTSPARVKLGVFGAIKSVITGEAEISEKEADETLGDLELELLEADVDLTVAEFMKERLKSRIVGTKVKRGELQAHVNDAIRATLLEVLENEKSFDFFECIDHVAEKPAKIIFLGINGAGKTTTIAKVASILQKRGKKVVLAAADTFRAAAIEQMQVHADRLGLKLIKRDYGSDPTSVAYDAVNHARAHGADVVLIDTAGRQDTNVSLINELKKMSRVIVPDIKLYVGESIAGNAIVEQISSFNREIGIDGVILTKLDLDAKGGTVLSINKATGVPIVLIGIGQGYDALETFDAERMVKRIVG